MFQTGLGRLAAVLAFALPAIGIIPAQTPAPSAIGWLRYAIPPDPPRYHDMPRTVVLLGDANGHAAPEEETAAEELDRGLGHMVAGTDTLLHRFDPHLDAIVLGAPDAVHRARLGRYIPGFTEKPLPEEGFRIVHLRRGMRQWWLLEGGSPRAELYAAFRFSALVAEDQQLPNELQEAPLTSLRAVQLEGAAPDHLILHEYARLLASVGMNGIILDGATPKAEAVRIFRPYGIRVWTGPADFEADRKLRIHPAISPDAPLSGLSLPQNASGAQAARLPLLPGGMRQPVTPLATWLRLFKGPAAHPEALIATVPSEAVVPLLDQPLFHVSLYAFGRFAWKPAGNRDAILDDWARQTWGDDARIFAVAKKIVMDEEDAYAGLTSPFGLPRLGNEHGPDPAAAARSASSGPLASREGIGADRLALPAWPADFRERYANTSATPAEWLLLLHHVPLSFHTRTDETILQAVYNAEFTGAATASNAADAWDETRDLVEPERWQPVHDLLQESARRAEIWREAVTEWLFRMTGEADALGFVGHHAGRIEAEAMKLTGYREVLTEEKESASAGAYLACATADCAATTEFSGAPNVYRLEVGYFDAASTPQRFTLLVNGSVRATWTSVARGAEPGGASAERFVLNGVRLSKQDRIEIRSAGPLDFLEITRDPRWN